MKRARKEAGKRQGCHGARAQANQWRMVGARGVEAIVGAMRALRGHAMVQLSALLAFIPLALENAMLQVRDAAAQLLLPTCPLGASCISYIVAYLLLTTDREGPQHATGREQGAV